LAYIAYKVNGNAPLLVIPPSHKQNLEEVNETVTRMSILYSIVFDCHSHSMTVNARLPTLCLVAFILLLSAALVTATEDPGCTSFWRSFDGSCNNLADPELGRVDSLFRRGQEGYFYEADGVTPIRSPQLPNERVISNALLNGGTTTSGKNHIGLSLLWTYFGQWIAHDMGINKRNETSDAVFSLPDTDTDAVLIPIIEPNDPLPPTVPVPARKFRIRTLRTLGQVVNGVFEVTNDATSYLDLSQVYGLSKDHSDALRTFVDGKLKTRDYIAVNTSITGQPVLTSTFLNWMPLVADTGVNTSRVVDLNQPDNECFSAGDPRVNENLGLIVLHGMFLRNHNLKAGALRTQYPHWSDEQIYQTARAWTTAIYQHVVFDEYLPTVLGLHYRRIGPYRGYDEQEDPTTSVLFSTAAFRFGHSSLINILPFRDRCNQSPYPDQPFRNQRSSAGQNGGTTSGLDLMAWVENPSYVVHGLSFEQSNEVDILFDDAMRNIQRVPFDVIAVNIMRGRLNGIPSYTRVRAAYRKTGTKDIKAHPFCSRHHLNATQPDTLACFSLITLNSTLAAKLREVYQFVDNVDAYVGLLAEDKFIGAVGPTTAEIIADQFKRSRNADRFWYENDEIGMFSRNDIRWIKSMTGMKYLLKSAFPDARVQNFPFLVPYDPVDFFAQCE
jgi:peroxidase